MNINYSQPHYLILKAIRSLLPLGLGLGLASLGLLCFVGPSLGAASLAHAHSSTVTPIDRELDLQNKLRLQEKITRELEENQRRALGGSQKDSEEYERSTPSELDEKRLDDFIELPPKESKPPP